MPVQRRSVRVLRLWYRLSLLPEVRALSHPAFRWLHGLVMQWTGHNNGAIEFTRHRHAAPQGLGHTEVFARARRDVLKTGLVMRTRIGGRNRPDTYALATVELQVQPLGTSHDPTTAKILGTSHDPMDEKIGTSHVPNRDVSRPKKNELHIRNARASEYGKEKTAGREEMLTTDSGAADEGGAGHEAARDNGAAVH